MPNATQQTLPVERSVYLQILDRLQHPYDHEAVETEEGTHLFVRVPAQVPDAVADLERAVEDLPPWLQDRLAAVYLVGRDRTVHVPGYTVDPMLRERLRADAEQAAQLRTRLDPAYDAVTYRSAGDPLGLQRFGLRIPRNAVAEIDEEDLNGIALAAGPLIDARRSGTIDAVLLVSDTDHLRIRPRDFFEDVAERWRGPRHRPARRPPRPPMSAPPAPPRAEGGFPAPAHRILPTGPPRRHVEPVDPIVELEEEVEAVPTPGPPPTVMDRVDTVRLELGGRLAVRLLRLHGYRVLEGVYHGRVRYAAAAERDQGAPRRVAVRTLPAVARRDLDHLVLDARTLGADLLIAIAPALPPELVARAHATRVRLVKPEDVARLRF